ncbi:hypothetical protein ScPMuIL_007758 [Solemya velum]
MSLLRDQSTEDQRMRSLVISAAIIFLLFAIIQETEGRCLVGCMAKFFVCKRRQEATGNEMLECCKPYQGCATECGIINPSCGKDMGQKRGSWNKRYGVDEYDSFDLSYL